MARKKPRKAAASPLPGFLGFSQALEFSWPWGFCWLSTYADCALMSFPADTQVALVHEFSYARTQANGVSQEHVLSAFLTSALSEASLFFSWTCQSFTKHPVHFLPISPLSLKGTDMRKFILPLKWHTTLRGIPRISASFWITHRTSDVPTLLGRHGTGRDKHFHFWDSNWDHIQEIAKQETVGLRVCHWDSRGTSYISSVPSLVPSMDLHPWGPLAVSMPFAKQPPPSPPFPTGSVFQLFLDDTRGPTGKGVSWF